MRGMEHAYDKSENNVAQKYEKSSSGMRYLKWEGDIKIVSEDWTELNWWYLRISHHRIWRFF